MKIKRSIEIPDRNKIKHWVKVKPEEFWVEGAQRNVIFRNLGFFDKMVYNTLCSKEYSTNYLNIDAFFINRVHLIENEIWYKESKQVYQVFVKKDQHSVDIVTGELDGVNSRKDSSLVRSSAFVGELGPLI